MTEHSLPAVVLPQTLLTYGTQEELELLRSANAANVQASAGYQAVEGADGDWLITSKGDAFDTRPEEFAALKEANLLNLAIIRESLSSSLPF